MEATHKEGKAMSKHFLNEICPTIWINGRGKNERAISAMRNEEEWTNWFQMLGIEAKGCRVDIENLPDTCNKRVILESFFVNASCVFFDKADSLISLPGIPTGDITLYGDPVKVNVHGRNGYIEEMPVMVRGGDNSAFIRKGLTGTIASKKAPAVYVRENANRFPFINITAEYAAKIANTMRELDVAISNLAHPYIVVATEDTIDEVKDFFKRKENHERWIDVISAGVFDANKVSVQELPKTEEGIRDCTGAIDWYLQLYRQLEYLDGAKDVDKKAEITIPELKQGDGIVNINAKKYIEFLEEEFDFVNKVFGTNMKPVLVKDKVEQENQEQAMQQAQTLQEGGNDDTNKHNDAQ